MKKWSFLVAVVMTLVLLLACGPAAPEPTPAPEPTLIPEPAAPPERGHLTPNPVEESKPIYGGTLLYGFYIPRSFDGHQLVGYGPQAHLPVFNQLVMFDSNYKECVPENIIGDLAESWEVSQDGTEITFELRQGLKWHDGVPFTANDVIFSLDKMNDVKRSAISNWFPAYESTEKTGEYAVKVHLKHPSAGYMIALAQGESVIQALHLSGTDDQSADFMIGTGPFILDELLTGVHLKYKKNPNYWKKDQYGNQLPYLDGLYYIHTVTSEMVIGRRVDLKSPVTGAGSLSTYKTLSEGAPEMLWQRRDKQYSMGTMYLNLNKKPLDDIRVRRAMALLVDERDLIIGYAGDLRFGRPDTGLVDPSIGLPKEELLGLMGWDKPMAVRVAEAQQLMADAGYPDGFKLNVVTAQETQANATMVFAEALRTQLNLDVEVNYGFGGVEMWKRVEEDNYDIFVYSLKVDLDPVQLDTYFGTDGHANWAHYSNPELDKMLAGLDRIIDPQKRKDAVQEIERILLTDLPALPTGCFAPNLMPYYPHVKNLRWTNISYSNVCRLEDVWLDESLRVK